MSQMGWQVYVAVTLGSALGGLGRYVMTAAIPSETFPWGTLAVNVLGSFIIGFFATLTAVEGRLPASAATRVFVMAGLCGGFTTFSAFSLQTLDLARDEQWLAVGGNIAGSVVLCLIAVWLGHIAAAALNQMKGA
jgi:fluoride exporter